MVLPKIVRVAVENTAFHFDKLYDYTLPQNFEPAKPGQRVLVPFGVGNRKRQGMIISERSDSEHSRLKPIYSIIDSEPILNSEMLSLAAWIKDRTFCTYYEAIKAMLPTGLYMQVKLIYKTNNISDKFKNQLSRQELQIWNVVKNAGSSGIEQEKILKELGLSSDNNLLEQLVQKKALERSDTALQRMGDATIKMVRPSFFGDELVEQANGQNLTKKQQTVLDLLVDVGVASVKEITYFSGVTVAVVNALEKKRLVETYNAELLRTPQALLSKTDVISCELNLEQKKAFDELYALYKKPTPTASLLFGVTGSGKTEVYMNLIDKVIDDNKQVLVLVPEIALTPQLLTIFNKRYGNRVAMLHSGLALGQRMDEWKRIDRGEATIILGTRSAIFAPCKNLGLIVMDEEQEHTYKSEMTPRYHARDIARWRCNYHNALLLLSSATPSVETYYAAKSGRFALQKLTSRYGAADLPEVNVVDMRLEPNNIGIIGTELKKEIENTVANGYQVILLLNRRGYNTFVSCRDCGHVVTCPDCSISLTYHSANNRVMCHYCGFSQVQLSKCPHCNSNNIRYSGLGTQKVQMELQELFPSTRILRMDTDTTMSRTAYEDKFGAFGKGQYDIMIGTQMVAKGLDFPKVRLVGVLLADQSLYSDDYRSFESSFALLTQVIGRAGRRDSIGKAVIQTYTPDNHVIELASAQDYESFYDIEITSRRIMKYPPYTDLCMFGFVGTDEQAVKTATNDFLHKLHYFAKGKYSDVPMIVLNPSPATVAKVAGKYRYKIIVKTRATKKMRAMTSELIIEFSKDPKNKAVHIFVDINPASVL